jgi:hypothetical protein
VTTDGMSDGEAAEREAGRMIDCSHDHVIARMVATLERPNAGPWSGEYAPTPIADEVQRLADELAVTAEEMSDALGELDAISTICRERLADVEGSKPWRSGASLVRQLVDMLDEAEAADMEQPEW